MNECGVCKSKIKSLLYCNGCFQRAKSVAERRGRVEELEYVLNVTNLGGISIENKIIEIHRYCENKLKELV